MRDRFRSLVLAALGALSLLGPALAGDAGVSEHGIFPLLGDRARERGHDFGDPYGMMPHYYYQTSKINIRDLKLGVNNGPRLRRQPLPDLPGTRRSTRQKGLVAVVGVVVLPDQFAKVYVVPPETACAAASFAMSRSSL
jgi:hypothetical protein